jgi:hypothetical protein
MGRGPADLLLLGLSAACGHASFHTVRNHSRMVASSRIFDGDPHPDFPSSTSGQEAFPDTLYYDVRFDLPQKIVRCVGAAGMVSSQPDARNKRDSRFFPGNRPAGILGITKQLLRFIHNHVNSVGYQAPPSYAALQIFQPLSVCRWPTRAGIGTRWGRRRATCRTLCMRYLRGISMMKMKTIFMKRKFCVRAIWMAGSGIERGKVML